MSNVLDNLFPEDAHGRDASELTDEERREWDRESADEMLRDEYLGEQQEIVEAAKRAKQAEASLKKLQPIVKAGRKNVASLKKARLRVKPHNEERKKRAEARDALWKKRLDEGGYLPFGKRNTIKDAAHFLSERLTLDFSKVYSTLRKLRSQGKL